jgi:hypothetical protein
MEKVSAVTKRAMPAGRAPIAIRMPISRRLPRLSPAVHAAIALACLPGMKSLLASFEQAQPHSWMAY